MTYDELVFFTFNMELLVNRTIGNSFITGLSMDDKDGRAKKAEELILEMAERIKNERTDRN